MTALSWRMGRNVGGELLFLYPCVFLIVFLSALTRRYGCRNFKIDVEQMALEATEKEAAEKAGRDVLEMTIFASTER